MMKHQNSLLFYGVIVLCLAITWTVRARDVRVDIHKTMTQLLAEEDTDHDQKITVDDRPVADSSRGDKRFKLKALDGRSYEIDGTYRCANLLQELAIQQAQGKRVGVLSTSRLFEDPVDRISRMIREYDWAGLTRRIDARHLAQILMDSKVAHQTHQYLYVPHDDPLALDYFTQVSRNLKDISLTVVRLPAKITPDYVQSLAGKHGLLTLKLEKTSSGDIAGVPFVVPGGRFNEMYGWDSYFEALGLLADGQVSLARSMVDNLVYEINHYGKILNANRSYYLTRSQPPFLTSMAWSIYQALPQNEDSRQWLIGVLKAAIREYKQVWMDGHHLTGIGLNRYYGTGLGVPPEVEPGHFDVIFRKYAQKHQMSLDQFKRQYKQGKIADPELDRFFRNDRAVRESGHDTTYRWRWKGKDRCADFVTVDLNSLLYKYEIDIAMMLRYLPAGAIPGETPAAWQARARLRKKRILTYLWNPDRTLFFDYNLKAQRQSDYIAATTLYPLWACDPNRPETRILDDNSAAACIQQALKFLESNGGILASARQSLERYGVPGEQRQWDYPYGWAPHQMLIWRALHNYGQTRIADRLIYKWLYTITRNAVDYNGTIPEKFDVVKRSHKVFAEYGNVGTKFSYITKEGFGWMNASYQVGLRLLSRQWVPYLKDLVPPEWITFQ